MFAFLFKTPIGIVISLFSGVIGLVVIVVVGTGVLAFTGGPAPCTPGGGVIVVDDANAQSFDTKWDQLSNALDGGTPLTVVLNESEVTSRANKFINSTGADVSNVRVCIHNGFGEVTGTVNVFLGSGTFKVKGTVLVNGGHPVIEFQDVQVGNVPGFMLAPFKTAVQNAIQNKLDDITLRHAYTPTLAEGNAQINGTP